jgi:DUF971 family protein
MRVAVSRGAASVAVTWDDGGAPAEFHHLWLRDNCACAACRHPDTWERTLDTFSLPLDLAPASVDVAGDVLVIEWPDGHVSRYAGDWLRAYRPSGDRDPLVPRQEPWDGSLQAPT